MYAISLTVKGNSIPEHCLKQFSVVCANILYLFPSGNFSWWYLLLRLMSLTFTSLRAK